MKWGFTHNNMKTLHQILSQYQEGFDKRNTANRMKYGPKLRPNPNVGI